ncbi:MULTISPECIES: SURF1 family protein [unclassified Cupriavidus]|uniref:SURF1 family protein n=1 Tax=unclassified Cupriavidus TaxID=2640874 RepID=UPI003F8F8B1A
MAPRHPQQQQNAGAARHPQPAPRRGIAALVVFAVLAAFAFSVLVGLGTWQVQRRAWKLDLIERVNSRVHAPPVAAPGRAQWPQVAAATDEYKHVRVSGTFLNDRETLVQAVTDLGGGFWVITPLRTADGSVVLVNRGFVSPERADRTTRSQYDPAGETTVTGLLRMSEAGDAFLRHNDPAANRWYNRDVPAIAAARGLQDVAPYFIDADAAAGGSPAANVAVNAAAADPEGTVPQQQGAQRVWPVGGLTVISFHNSHLGYAITWYGLALMVALGAFLVGRQEYRRRKGS